MPQDKSPFVGVFHISGCFDLRPLLPTSIAAPLRMSSEEAAANSPLAAANAAAAAENMAQMAHVAFYYGEHDAPGLIEQGKEYGEVRTPGATNPFSLYSERAASNSSPMFTRPRTFS